MSCATLDHDIQEAATRLIQRLPVKYPNAVPVFQRNWTNVLSENRFGAPTFRIDLRMILDGPGPETREVDFTRNPIALFLRECAARLSIGARVWDRELFDTYDVPDSNLKFRFVLANIPDAIPLGYGIKKPRAHGKGKE